MTGSSVALSKELKRLLQRKTELEKELEVVERQIKDIRPVVRVEKKNYSTGESRNGNEEYLVAASYLKPMLDYYIKLGNAQYMLAMNSKVSAKTISRIRSGETKYVGLTTAERLTIEMNVNDLLGTEELPIEVNTGQTGFPRRPPSQFYED
jgi:hypothetical protein